jgi:LysM repeat protein
VPCGARTAAYRAAVGGTLRERRLPAGSGRTPIRLTRRGRVVLVCFLVLLTLATSALALRDSSVATNRSGELRYRTVVVSPGQTLWEIARESAPGVDPRITVARIMKFNALTSAVVQPGQEIAIPR